MELRAVVPDDHRALGQFSCAGAETGGFALEVEQYIRVLLVEELAAGYLQVIGSWDGDRLGAVIAPTSGPVLWKVTALATDVAYRRRKQALRLKRGLLRRAREAGVRALVSQVHRDNHLMLALNRKLGGVIDPPTGDEPYLVCTVPTR